MRKIKSDERSDQNKIKREMRIAFELFKPKTFTKRTINFIYRLNLIPRSYLSYFTRIV